MNAYPYWAEFVRERRPQLKPVRHAATPSLRMLDEYFAWRELEKGVRVPTGWPFASNRVPPPPPPFAKEKQERVELSVPVLVVHQSSGQVTYERANIEFLPGEIDFLDEVESKMF